MYQKLKNWLKSISKDLSEAVKRFHQYNEDVAPKPQYELLIIDKVSRGTVRKKFFQIKEAIASVSPEIQFDLKHEYLLFHTGHPNNPCIKLNRLNESNANTRIVQTRKKSN